MKIAHALKTSIGWLIAILIGVNFTLFNLSAEQRREPRTNVVVKGAEVIVLKGSTRYWKDVNKTPLHLRTTPRKTKPILNLNYDRPIVKYSTTPDPVVQRTYTGQRTPASRTPYLPTPSRNFNGMNYTANGSGWPPDTTGDVGPTYYVQSVNASIGIYRKSDGSLVSATTINDFFEGVAVSGTPCDEDNHGDPIVLYDQYAQRWFILDFAWAPSESDGSYFAIAVSKTNDPTGAWWQYAMRADNTLMNDYPKAGIWHDGIYITANMFEFDDGFQGSKVWALKKPAIYNGTLTAQTIPVDTNYYAWSILPANAKGSTPPPADAPNYMYAYDADEWGHSGNDVLAVWKYDVDWTTPANTTWTGPTLVNTAAFSVFNGYVPQPGTSRTLDTLANRLMYSAIYRNFTTHQSVYLCQMVSVGGVGAMRWYEVRIASGTSSIYQQGTYQPDSHHRWMGSIAADRKGGIALGYSVASSTLYPSIRFAARLASDPLGTLSQGEASLIEGTGSQTSIERWGDYSTMSIDPDDDLTFWYTQEYLATSGSNWLTRISSFRLANPDTRSDFNEDSKIDLFMRYYNTGGWNQIWYMNGINKTSSATVPSIPDLNWKMNAVGDFNNDGKQDLLWRYYGANGGWNMVWYMNGATKLGSADLPRIPDTNWQIADTGDFNHDGNTDILWRYYGTNGGWNMIWYMNGVTKIGTANIERIPDINWRIEATGDFNNDYKTDILWRYYGTNGGWNMVWLMNGITKTETVNIQRIPDINWKIEGTGDFNYDGKTDVFWRYYGANGGWNMVWYMNGTNVSSSVNPPRINDINWKIWR